MNSAQHSVLRQMAFSAVSLLFISHSWAESPELRDAQGHSLSVSATPFKSRSGTDDMPFTRYEGSLFGLDRDNNFSPRDFYPPFFNGGGLSSGDIDRDGWPDIVSASGAEIKVYMNREGRHFTPVDIEVGGLEDSAIFNVALVDLDGDGWLDLFVTTYLQGNFFILNRDGELSAAALQRPPRGKSVLSAAVSFGDVDRDGDLDAAVGNWFAGMSKKHPPLHSQNELWTNEGGKFEVEQLPGLVGETLSVLLSDWSGDGWLDLIVGNDFDAPDIYYRGDRRGGFELIERGEGIIPHSTNTTMSVDTGDFDNDLDLDIFLDQITARATGPSTRLKGMPLRNYCNSVVDPSVRERCVANMAIRLGFSYGANHRPTNIKICSRLRDPANRQACMGMQVTMTAQRFQDQELCASIPNTETRTRSLCENFFELTNPHDPEVLEQSIPQRMNENVLLAWDASQGRFTDEAGRVGVGFTGWSWNAHFADVDNDEWQDIFIVAGSWFRATPSGTTANFFFHNEEGKTFSDQTDAFGLQNHMIVSAYTIVDFDRDGDLDFVTNSVNGPLWLLRNNTGNRNSIVFQLHDEVGNRDGIGTVFTIHYGPGAERHQMRELKAGGGYLSFDEPQAHFGLGQYSQVERLEIRWSTGGKTVIPGPFEAGHHYLLKRYANGAPNREGSANGITDD